MKIGGVKMFFITYMDSTWKSEKGTKTNPTAEKGKGKRETSCTAKKKDTLYTGFAEPRMTAHDPRCNCPGSTKRRIRKTSRAP